MKHDIEVGNTIRVIRTTDSYFGHLGIVHHVSGDEIRVLLNKFTTRIITYFPGEVEIFKGDIEPLGKTQEGRQTMAEGFRTMPVTYGTQGQYIGEAQITRTFTGAKIQIEVIGNVVEELFVPAKSLAIWPNENSDLSFEIGDMIRVSDSNHEFWDDLGRVMFAERDEVKVRLNRHRTRIVSFKKSQIENYDGHVGGTSVQ